MGQLRNYYRLISVAVYLHNYWVIKGQPSLNFLPLLEIKWKAHIKSPFLHLIFFPSSSTHPHPALTRRAICPHHTSTSMNGSRHLPYLPPSRPGSKIHRMRVLTWVIHKINFEYWIRSCLHIHIHEYLEGSLWIPDSLNNQGFAYVASCL
jgi:hypothetical protein